MTLFDYIVIAVLVASIVVSVLRGLVREVLSLIVWIVAFVLANRFAEQMGEMLPGSIPGTAVRLIVGFAIIFILILILGGLMNLAIASLIRAAGLQVADRGLGGLFGLARGVVIVLTGVILAGLTSLPQQPFWKDALLSPLAEQGVRTIKPWLPDDWARHVHY